MTGLIIREELASDRHAAELVAKRAFWNKHVPGCDEHYLLHKLRDCAEYRPELSRVAELDGRVVGGIYYVTARIEGGGESHDILSFGPLCVDPDYQRQGIGGALLETTLGLARAAGWRGAVIYGEPDYYPLHGFKTCDNFGITTPDGKNFSAFMGRELTPGALASIPGAFHEPAVYYDLPPAAVDEFDRQFPYMPKLKLPGQWA